MTRALAMERAKAADDYAAELTRYWDGKIEQLQKLAAATEHLSGLLTLMCDGPVNCPKCALQAALRDIFEVVPWPSEHLELSESAKAQYAGFAQQ